MGRDHTIYATVPGYVRFYREKEKWMRGERRYVDVVLERGDKQPRIAGYHHSELPLRWWRRCITSHRRLRHKFLVSENHV